MPRIQNGGLFFEKPPTGIADPRFQLIQFALTVGEFAGQCGPVGSDFSLGRGDRFRPPGQVANLSGGSGGLDGSPLLPFPTLALELAPRVTKPALVQLEFAVEMLNPCDDRCPVGGEPVCLLTQLSIAHIGFLTAGLPVASATLDQPAAQLGETLPLGLGGSQRFGCFFSCRGQIPLLLFGQCGVGGPLLAQGGAGFGDLILKVEELPPLVPEPAGELLLLPKQRGLAIDEPQFLLADSRLLGHDRRHLNAERLQLEIGVARVVHASPLG